MWVTIITLALKLLGMGLKKRSDDKETHRKFLELVAHLQSKNLVSADMKIEREDRLSRLETKTDQE
jgi:hypothetical protein